MEKPKGLIFKEAREAKGISLKTVHEATKIPMDALHAIEEGYRVRTLSPFYLKGFMKMYAQYLGIHVNEVIEDYHEEKLPQSVSKRNFEEDVAAKVSAIFPPERQKQVVVVLGILLALFLILKVGGCLMRKVSSGPGAATARRPAPVRRPERKKPLKIQASVSGQKEAVKTKSTPAPKETPKQPVQEPPPAPEKKKEHKNIVLEVKVKRRGWIQVKTDGNLVFQSMLEEGTTETWQADKAIELSGKLIHDLQFTLNGETIGGLSRSDRNARRVVVTQKGLSVIQ